MTLHRPRKTLQRARELRRQQTDLEKRLWGYLRDRRLGSYKFVRRAALDPFIADFLCREKKLIVEVDGATHSEESDLARDARRTALLACNGYRVLRVNSADVFQRLPDVLDMILLGLEGKL